MSGSVQTWLQPALSVMLGERGTCDIRFSLQGAYVSDDLADDLRLLGIDDTVVTINGSALNASKEIEEADFVDVSDAALARIRNRFTAYLEGQELPRGSTDLFILDIEGAVSPTHIGGLDRERRDAVIAGYKARIREARDVLRTRNVPDVTLGLYQVIVPDGRGRVTDEFRLRMCGYDYAACGGMYDELDYICPVLYQRFGPDDGGAEQVQRWIDAATRQAIDSSLTLTRSNGAVIPLCPILTFWVANSPDKSNNASDAVSPESILWQLRTLRRYRAREVAIIVLWAGREDTEGSVKPREPVDFREFLHSVGELPPPACPVSTAATETIPA
jgi:hypothetical protein